MDYCVYHPTVKAEHTILVEGGVIAHVCKRCYGNTLVSSRKR